MKSSNPVFGRGYAAIKPGTLDRTVEQLEASYAAPAASSLHTGRMTIDDVVIRTSILFVVLVAVGGFAWSQNLGGGVLLLGAIGGLVIAMVNSFSKRVRPAAAIGYAACEGLVLGVLSHMYETQYPGIVSQAVLGTIAAFAGVLIAYTSKKVQVTPQFQRAMMGALIGYMVLGFISMIAAFAGVGGGYGFYGVSGLGLLLAVGGVAFASFFLILDFDMVAQMIKNGAPQEESWRAGFGLMVTVVWLYMEILRLISILRRD
jgi:uncharacterized YccA/Bax inhibitor family protein